MTYVNPFNCPTEYQNSLEEFDGDRNSQDLGQFTASTLSKNPREVALINQHKDAIETDVRDRFKIWLGQAIHLVLANNAPRDTIVEKRIGITFKPDGFPSIKLSGQIDKVQNGILTDYKTTTTNNPNFKRGVVPYEYEAQLNVYDYLCRCNSINVTDLEIEVVYIDWNKTYTDRSGYPQSPFQTIPVQKWSELDQEKYIHDRLAKHYAAKTQLPLCSDAERWYSDEKFAVMKPDRKSAIRVFDSNEEAMDAIANCKDVLGASYTKHKDKLYVDFRAGEYKKCENFCDAAPFCSQHNTFMEAAE